MPLAHAEVFQRALRLRFPKLVSRQLDHAQAVDFSAKFRTWNCYDSNAYRDGVKSHRTLEISRLQRYRAPASLVAQGASPE
jgi:hypothetical protein